jgi:hypothetical protein
VNERKIVVTFSEDSEKNVIYFVEVDPPISFEDRCLSKIERVVRQALNAAIAEGAVFFPRPKT